MMILKWYALIYYNLSAEELMLFNCGVGEDSWESLGLQGDQSWVFIGRTDTKAETPILWPPHVKSWLIGKDPDAGRDWGQEEKGTTEDEMAGWHHWLDGHEFEWTPGVGDGQGGLACCDSWGRSQTQLSDWTEYTIKLIFPFPSVKVIKMCVCVWVCVCVRERERETENDLIITHMHMAIFSVTYQ